MLRVRYVALAFAIAVVLSGEARAEPLKVLTAGAFKQVLLAVIPQFEASGRKVKWETATVGNIINRIEAGESFDLVIASPAALTALGKSGKLEGGIDLAKVGVGMAIREGAAKPDIGSVDAFKQALLAAKSVAYVDPAAGGSSGIYVSGLIDRLGIGAEVRRKAVLVQGGGSRRERRSRYRAPADQRNPPRQRRGAGRPAAFRDSELYDIFRCHRRW
jgi:molybdate transport system substrate-binding protein